MSDNIKKYKVSIFGETYIIVSDEPEEQVFAAAQIVDHCMRDICNKGQVQESKRVAVLTALQYASKFLACKKVVEAQEQYNDKLINLIDKQLSEINN